MSAGPSSLRVSGSYIYLPAQLQSQVVTNPASGQNVLYGKREQLTFNVTAKLTHYWSLQAAQTINLTSSTTVVNGVAAPPASSASLYASLSAIYQDECMAFIGSVTQSGIRNGDVTPGVAVLFSVVFKNLGEIGGTVARAAESQPPSRDMVCRRQFLPPAGVVSGQPYRSAGFVVDDHNSLARRVADRSGWLFERAMPRRRRRRITPRHSRPRRNRRAIRAQRPALLRSSTTR